MIIEELEKLDPWHEQAIKKCFNCMAEKDRKMIWSDGEYHDTEGKFYLALTGNPTYQKVVGCLIATKDYIEIDKPFVKEVEVMTLFVHPDYRRKHVGQILLELAKRKASTELLMAKIYNVNRASINLFLECGFFDVKAFQSGEKFYDFLNEGQSLFLADKW